MCYNSDATSVRSGEHRSPRAARGNWNYTKTFTTQLCPRERTLRDRLMVRPSLGLCSMILLVSSLILAILVLAWIAWIAFEPRSTTSPVPTAVHTFLGKPGGDEGEEGVPASATGQETDYQRHVRNRIEDPQLPLGTVAGAAIPVGARTTQRETDPPDGSWG